VLFNSSYWKGFLDWLRDKTLSNDYITEEDLHLLRLSDDPVEVVDIIRSWYLKQAITGRQAVS
jgi:predicted Rossmann-fold nucleotide-binding protein